MENYSIRSTSLQRLSSWLMIVAIVMSALLFSACRSSGGIAMQQEAATAMTAQEDLRQQILLDNQVQMQGTATISHQIQPSWTEVTLTVADSTLEALPKGAVIQNADTAQNLRVSIYRVPDGSIAARAQALNINEWFIKDYGLQLSQTAQETTGKQQVSQQQSSSAVQQELTAQQGKDPPYLKTFLWIVAIAAVAVIFKRQ